MSILQSFWKEDVVYKASFKDGYKIKVYIMKDEFEQDAGLESLAYKFVCVKVTYKRKSTEFMYIMTAEDFNKDNFTILTHFAKKKWRSVYEGRKSV